MPALKVDITEFAKLWESKHPAIAAAIDKGLMSGVLRGQKKVIEKSPVDTGLYQSSWAVDRKGVGHVQLGNSAPHAPVIEFGARPHTPPLGPLLGWAARQLQKGGPPYPPEVWKLAKGVQNKIAAVGQQPKRVLSDSLEEIRRFIIQEIDKELQKLGR